MTDHLVQNRGGGDASEIEPMHFDENVEAILNLFCQGVNLGDRKERGTEFTRFFGISEMDTC